MVRDAIADQAARDLLVASPAFFLVRAARDAQSDGTRALLREARRFVAAYNASRSPDDFLALLDFAYLAVHNGDLDSRDNVGLRAIYDWTREAVAFPALERWIMSGHDATVLLEMGWDPAVPPGTKLRDRRGVLPRTGRRRARAADHGEPAPGRLGRQEVHRPWDAASSTSCRKATSA